MEATFQGAARPPSRTPKTKKPVRIIPNWPPSGAIAARIANNGNFWTHARSVGLENPWDLIIFNFQTEDPLEVNWYLQKAVGCWLVGPAGNFDFQDALTNDGKDGLIYIPRNGWRPPASFKKGSGAGTFIMGVRHSVAAILRDLSVKMPTIAYGATVMRPQDYRTIADLIDTNVVSIEIDPGLVGNGGYSPEDKAIILKHMPRIGNAKHAASIANEAVHVITHYREIPHDVLRNEYVSTVAGAIAMGVTSERVLNEKVNPTDHENWGYYYSGWVWINLLKPKGIWHLHLTQLDQQFEHPNNSTTPNAFAALKDSMRENYGKKAGTTKIPLWD
jgi:hypothetical protein